MGQGTLDLKTWNEKVDSFLPPLNEYHFDNSLIVSSYDAFLRSRLLKGKIIVFHCFEFFFIWFLKTSAYLFEMQKIRERKRQTEGVRKRERKIFLSLVPYSAVRIEPGQIQELEIPFWSLTWVVRA